MTWQGWIYVITIFSIFFTFALIWMNLYRRKNREAFEKPKYDMLADENDNQL